MRLAVLGSPIAHSLSPLLHNAAYRHLGVVADYQKCEVNSEEFAKFLETHPPNYWRGFSLTMPLKEIGLQFSQEVEARGIQAGAINTLISNGVSWRGVNTDISGFEGLFESIEFERVSILGAGGTARAALVALASVSAHIKVFRRNSRRDADLLRAHPDIAILDWGDLRSATNCDLLINCTPTEASGDLAGLSGKIETVIDSLYSPWPPPLFQSIQAVSAYSGKDLLVAQALEQISLFSGVQFEKAEMFARLRTLI